MLRRIYPVWCVRCFLLAILFSAPGVAIATKPAQNILIVHSYHQGFRWTDSVMAGMLDVLQREVAGGEVFVEYIDAKRYPPEAFSTALIQSLSVKVQWLHPKIILVSDDAAFDLILSLRDRMFPGVPLVFCGVNNFKQERIAGQVAVTGVVEEFDIKRTIELILALHKQASHIAVVSDSTETGAANVVRFRMVAQAFAGRIQFHELFDLSTDELLEQSAKLPQDTIILNLSFFRDRVGKSYSTYEGNHIIASHTRKPVYSCWDFMLAGDVVGGYVVSGRQQGEAAAAIAARILKGTRTEEIPVLYTSPNVYMFDYEVLKRFGIKESDLPDGSIILNSINSIWERYWALFVAILVIGGLQLFLILALLARGRTLKTVNVALRDNEKRFRSLFESSSAVMLLVDVDSGQIKDANPAASKFYGYSHEELVSMIITDINQLPPEQLAEKRQRFMRKEQNLFIFPHRLASGEIRTVEVHASRIAMGDNILLFSIIFDITERKQMEEQLLFRALHDPLTGLANRTLCMDRISQAMERSRRRAVPHFAVIFMDLDRFKLVNDSLGHWGGDQLLREVASRLLAATRRMDTVCRYGGDEFVVVLEELSMREALRTTQRIRESFKMPVFIGAHSIQIEASFGIAFPTTKDTTTAEDLLRNANIALHHAKRQGRNRVVHYKPSMHQAAIQVMSLEVDMRRGFAQGEFEMFYQPIFRLSNSQLVGFEALLRWRHPVRGIISPSEFIPVAEESGFIIELGGFALSRACMDMVSMLNEAGAEQDLTVSVNLSPRQFSRQGLSEQIEDALTASGLPPKALVLEITESSIIKHPEYSARILTRLRSRGIGVAVDDFGTGYSSLGMLKRLPVDRLKIDMGFVTRITQDAHDHEIVRAIATLGRALGLMTVAEGIETQEQFQRLRDLGCELGQGYICARPMPLAETSEVIQHGHCFANE